MAVAGDEFLDLGVGAVDVVRLAREGAPAEGADAAAEERPYIGRHEPGELEGIGDAHLLRHLPDVVAVIERRHAGVVEVEHGADMDGHRLLGGALDRRRIAAPRGLGLLQRPAGRQIAVDRVVRARLVGDHVGPDAAAVELGKDLGGVAEEADRKRLFRRVGLYDESERLVERLRPGVEIAGFDALLDARRLALDGEQRGAGHRRGERLGTAHAAEPAGQDPAPGEIAAVVLPSGLDEGLVGALDDALAADIDPRPGRHLALEGAQRSDDSVVAAPVARGAADAAIDDELLRVLGDLGVEVVHQHAERRLGEPALAGESAAARGADAAGVVEAVGCGHEGLGICLNPSPALREREGPIAKAMGG